MKILYIAFSLVAATLTNAQVIGQNDTCIPKSNNITLCEQLLDCIEIIIGAPVDYCGTEMDDFCDLLQYIYDGITGVNAICDITQFYLPTPTPTTAPTASSFPTESPEGGGIPLELILSQKLFLLELDNYNKLACQKQ
jgi:hypothetical protein